MWTNVIYNVIAGAINFVIQGVFFCEANMWGYGLKENGTLHNFWPSWFTFL